MQVFTRRKPPVPEVVEQQGSQAITAALQSIVTVGDQFMVNDTRWYMDRNGKATRCVMNSADYLSNRFQSTLRDKYGWAVDVPVAGHEIDAYKEFPCEIDAYYLEPDGLLELVRRTWEDEPERDISQMFSDLYHRYIKRSSHSIDEVGAPYRHHFLQRREKTAFKVGLEFETGYIASSFRAFSKLNTLYAGGHIDVGVFITSDRKDTTAGRIWPLSTRNGSFEELERLEYLTNIRFPIWEFAFQPDGYDTSVGYLGADGNLYHVVDIGGTRQYGRRTFRMFTRRVNGEDEEVMLRV